MSPLTLAARDAATDRDSTDSPSRRVPDPRHADSPPPASRFDPKIAPTSAVSGSVVRQTSGMVRWLFGRRSTDVPKPRPVPPRSSAPPSSPVAGSLAGRGVPTRAPPPALPTASRVARAPVLVKASGAATSLTVIGGAVAAAVVVSQFGIFPVVGTALSYVPSWAHGADLWDQIRALLTGHSPGGFSIGWGP